MKQIVNVVIKGDLYCSELERTGKYGNIIQDEEVSNYYAGQATLFNDTLTCNKFIYSTTVLITGKVFVNDVEIEVDNLKKKKGEYGNK